MQWFSFILLYRNLSKHGELDKKNYEYNVITHCGCLPMNVWLKNGLSHKLNGIKGIFGY